jgi:hypothetical protein
MHRIPVLTCAFVLAACAGDDSAGDTSAAPSDTTSVAQTAAAAPAMEFSYGGITVPDTFAVLSARYPLSRPRGPIEYIRLVQSEAHDGITAIGFVKGEAGARVSISFEKDPGIVTVEPPSKRNPRCETIYDKLVSQYGPPDSLRQFANDVQIRSDRHWTRGQSAMVLICFKAGDSLYADALALEKRKND